MVLLSMQQCVALPAGWVPVLHKGEVVKPVLHRFYVWTV